MKLKLENLAPYLPYNLMITSGGKGRPLEMTSNGNSNSSSITISIHEVSATPYLKPILRPLSDLTNEMYWSLSGKDPKNNFAFWYGKNATQGEYIHKEGYSSSQYSLEKYRNMPYYMILFFLENHFDIFGLIDQGLAIDINTLNK